MKFLYSFVFLMFFGSELTTEGKTTHISLKSPYDITVAPDGSGTYKTVQEALNAVRDHNKERTVIFIKNGVYKEKLVLASAKENVTLIGESKEGVILTYDDYSKRVVGTDTIKTPTSYSFVIKGDGFIGENITFQNSAGPVGQAVAVMIDSDRVIFKNCRFLGNQDTLFTRGTGRCYFTQCYIEGTTDFIFGAAIAMFENCQLYSKKNSYVTAASTPQGNKFGYILHNCTLSADTSIHKAYLGRPWRPFARVVYITCELGNHIIPAGWDNWRNAENEKTAFYAEYRSSGPGANLQSRVTWSHQLTESEAKTYQIKNIFAKDAAVVPFQNDWDPLK